MKIFDDGKVLEFRFSPGNTLLIDRNEKMIKYKKQEANFEDVKGFWKNYVIRRKKKRYYVVLLTQKWMAPVTPEMDEYDVDEVIHYLIEIFGEEKYAR